MIRFPKHAGLALLVFSGIAITANPAAASAPPASSQPSQPKKKPPAKKPKKAPRGLAHKALRTVVSDARFDKMTFEDFAEWLSRYTGANVVVKWKLLEESGVKRDAMITLRLKEVPVRKLLPLVFNEVTRGLADVELAANADDNTLTISTKADLDRILLTRVYDVNDLIITVPNFTGRSISNPGLGRNRPLGLGSGGSESSSNQPDAQVQELINLITSAIEPTTWRVNGGKGTIVFFKGKLVVRNNAGVHEKLGGKVAVPKPKGDPKSGKK